MASIGSSTGFHAEGGTGLATEFNGRTVLQLMSITTLKPTTQEVVVSVEQSDGTTRPERKLVVEDMAEEEAGRIFARLVVHSAPRNIAEALKLDVGGLRDEERKIIELGPAYLERAASVIITSIFENPARGEVFFNACGASHAPEKGEKDWVIEWGWDRNNAKDGEEMRMLQGQYLAVAQACYRLGYRRAAIEFQPFLQNAKTWYNIFANYLVSPLALREMGARALKEDKYIQRDFRAWVTKLQILEEEAGPDFPDKAHTIQGVVDSLVAAAARPMLARLAKQDPELASRIGSADPSAYIAWKSPFVRPVGTYAGLVSNIRTELGQMSA